MSESQEEEVLSDVDPDENPYYPETQRTLVGHSRSGRPIYSVRRLVVTLPCEGEEQGGIDNAMSETDSDDEHHEEEEEEEESDGADSFVTDDEDDIDPNADFKPGNGI
jgi:hypothetical protein